MNENRLLLPEKLKQLRQAYGYTQDYVASCIGVVRQTYSHYEKGRRIPDGNVLYALSRLYDVSLDSLMDYLTDAPKRRNAVTYDDHDLKKMLEYFDEPQRRSKYGHLSSREKVMLFYFDQIAEGNKWELIEFAKVLSRKKH